MAFDCAHPASLARFWAAALDSYQVAPSEEAELARLRGEASTILRTIQPCAVLLANRACHALFGADIVGANLTHRFLADPAARQAIANWPEVAWAGLDRLRHQLDRTPFDQQLGQLVDLAETTLSGVPGPHQPSTDPVVCPWFRIGDQVVKTVGIAARFESAAEITLDELRIELTYRSTPTPHSGASSAHTKVEPESARDWFGA